MPQQQMGEKKRPLKEGILIQDLNGHHWLTPLNYSKDKYLGNSVIR